LVAEELAVSVVQKEHETGRQGRTHHLQVRLPQAVVMARAVVTHQVQILAGLAARVAAVAQRIRSSQRTVVSVKMAATVVREMETLMGCLVAAVAAVVHLGQMALMQVLVLEVTVELVISG
jgi:hypothetical protein